MRSVAMCCFSLVQFPRSRLHYLRILSSSYDAEGGYVRRSINTKSGEDKAKIGPEIIPGSGTDSTSSSCKVGGTGGRRSSRTQRSWKISIASSAISQSKAPNLAAYEVETVASESDRYHSDLAKVATPICFDIETTGFSRERGDRIIEFACQDLRGGDSSTFQTLVNPERDVPNQHIHGISTHMVNRPDVPRMKDLIPILVDYIASRRILGGPVILISHNGRTFDVPFLKKEFSRCSHEIPPYWLFVDTVPLARILAKSLGPEVGLKINLQALREYYSIPLIGPAHRALSDVHTLALVLQKMTSQLKITVPGLIKQSFR